MTMKNVLRLACAIALGFTAGTAMGVDNTGTGGVITYTDASGLNPVASPPYIGGYVVHIFTNNGTLNIPLAASADLLVVAGGGGGGANGGGGGGAGGLIYSNAFPVVGGSNYTVTVGGGGAGSLSGSVAGSSGTNSVFGTLTAVGGGGGGSRDGGKAGLNGGSGGGGGAADSGAGTKGSGTAGPPRQGYDGGTGIGNGTIASAGGGGGGAGGVGTNGVLNLGGNGGNGVTNTITGSIIVYGGGGGGGTTGAGSGSTGGIGGGGNGVITGTAGSGGTNTGGGGGGGGGGVSSAGNGGSGIVIVRYPYADGSLSVAVTAPANGQICFAGSPITASATVVSGTSPYDVSFFADTAGGGMVQVGTTQNGAGQTFTQSLGTPAIGTYQVYATVTDNVTSNATSVTNTFTVVVPSSNAYLSNLVPSVGTLSPTFTSNNLIYAATVLNAVSSLTVTPTAAESYATIRVNGAIVASGSASASISLGVGDNVITNQVISQDMTMTNSYTLTVTRVRGSTSQYWSGNGSSQGGNGTWDTTNPRWGTVAGGPFGSAWGNVYNDTAIFGGTAGTVTLGTDIQAAGLTFGVSGYTIGGAYTLTLGANSSILANVASPGRTIGFADGVVVTNVYQVQVGYGNSLANNSLTLTNGARIFVANSTSIGYTTGGNGSSGNTLTIVGGAADSIYNAGNQNVDVGCGSGALAAGNQIVIGIGGSMTNVASIDIGRASATSVANAASRNAIRVTGGKLFMSGSIRIGASSGSTAPSRTNALTVAEGGVVNVAGGLYVGVTGYNMYDGGDNTQSGNSLTVTNGGRLFTKADCYIGSDADNLYQGNPAWKGTLYSNLATVGGSLNGTDATWNLGGQKLYVGYAGYANSIAMYNRLTASQGGVVTNISTLTVKADNTVELAPGGKIYATAATINGTLSVSTDDAVTPSCGHLKVSGTLNVANATLNLVMPPKPLPGAVYIIGSYGTLTGLFKGTNGLPVDCILNMNYNSLKQIAVVVPPPRGTLITFR